MCVKGEGSTFVSYSAQLSPLVCVGVAFVCCLLVSIMCLSTVISSGLSLLCDHWFASECLPPVQEM